MHSIRINTCIYICIFIYTYFHNNEICTYINVYVYSKNNNTNTTHNSNTSNNSNIYNPISFQVEWALANLTRIRSIGAWFVIMLL